MNTKHTPGPWEEYAGNIRTVARNEKYGEGYRVEFRSRPIASIVDMRGQSEMNAANARLITAAPDGLAANIKARDAIIDVLGSGMIDCDGSIAATLRDAMKECNAAIAKATNAA